jgi:hypothetical protein
MNHGGDMKQTTLIGALLSTVWVASFALLLFLKRDTFDGLTLNEWGDLFSGFAAPLALIWLILGYIQQGQELHLNTHALEAQEKEFKLNTEALKAQQEELKNQVIATNTLAEITARQAKASEDLVDLKKVDMAGSFVKAITSQK